MFAAVEIHLFFMRRAYGHSDATSLFSGLFARKRRPHWLTPEEWEEEKWRKKGMKYRLKHGKYKARKISKLRKKYKKYKYKKYKNE